MSERGLAVTGIMAAATPASSWFLPGLRDPSWFLCSVFDPVESRRQHGMCQRQRHLSPWPKRCGHPPDLSKRARTPVVVHAKTAAFRAGAPDKPCRDEKSSTRTPSPGLTSRTELPYLRRMDSRKPFRFEPRLPPKPGDESGRWRHERPDCPPTAEAVRRLTASGLAAAAKLSGTP